MSTEIRISGGGPETPRPRRTAPSKPGPGDMPPFDPSPEDPAPSDPKPAPDRPIPPQPEIGDKRSSVRSCAMRTFRWTWILVAAAVIPACGGSSPGPTPGVVAPPPEAVNQAHKAAPSFSLMNQATAAASDGVVDGSNPGTTSSKPGASPSSIGFAGTVNATVDLDAIDSAGHDRWPHVTGRLGVVAQGSVQGAGGSGIATYQVTVTALTNILFTDPVTDDTATLASGSQWSYSLVVDWMFADAADWSIKASSDGSIAGVSVTGMHGGLVFSATIEGERQATSTFAKAAGVFSAERTVSATLTVVFTDSTGSHEVIVEQTSADSIRLTVDGATYGPFTRAQWEALFLIHLE